MKNFCVSIGLMSTCSAVNIKDRQTCGHFNCAGSNRNECSHLRPTFNDHCDCIPAQRNEEPKPKEQELIELSLEDLIMLETEGDSNYETFNTWAKQIALPQIQNSLFGKP